MRLETIFLFLVLGSRGFVEEPRTWSFDKDPVGKIPAGFQSDRTGQGTVGEWIVEAVADAPSKPQAVKQASTDSTDYRFPVLVASEGRAVDGSVSVRFKPVSGRVDQAGGLVFRYRDKDNYYLTRANALEDNVRLYYVKNGSRKQFAGWNGKVGSGAWHELKAAYRGNHFVIFFDGKQIIEATDETFKDAGSVGLWTKADSVTLFDDLRWEP